MFLLLVCLLFYRVLLGVYYGNIHETGSISITSITQLTKAVKFFGGLAFICWHSEPDPIKRSAFHVAFFLRKGKLKFDLSWCIFERRIRVREVVLYLFIFYLNTYFMEWWFLSSRANFAWREHRRLCAQERKVHCGSRGILCFSSSFVAIQQQYLAAGWEYIYTL